MWFCRKKFKVVLFKKKMDASNWIQFDDDYFEVKEKKLIDDNVKFNPVMCYPKWFFSDERSETAERLQQQANFCYWTKDFSNAVSFYNKALENYFSNSPFMRRNLLESIARCYFQLGDLSKAQALAEECLPMSYTVELKTSILNLLCTVYKSQSLLEQEKATLLQLISLHPQNYRVWLDLAQCFSAMRKREGSHLMVLMEAACFLRISLLIGAMKNNEGLATLDMANKKLQCMNLPENFCDAGKKFFSQDLLEEHLAVKPKDLTRPDDSDSPEVIKEANDLDSEDFWFKWVQEFL
ncbi:uncharacterized protein C8orf76 homolog [Ischnura elegans]|uniref:uncharacterized protein C8orf76 homolog n=1 Tax=Ischnura elegans TaxID=197161 RepID=UPI001ED8A806|nr:uncharacterized protein C8orf76 homolog [Ischnura elegans]